MDLSSPLLSYFTQNSWSCPSSDSDFYNISSPEAVSPTSYMDFSPSVQWQSSSSPPHSGHLGGTKAPISGSLHEASGRSRGGTRRTRSKNPSKQRQSASEKEKLRMRDLTKALQHLRTYLPPSVAPVSQTLTKIETLRLTIRYISYLSAQLGLSEESDRNQAEEFCWSSSTADYWGFRDGVTAHQEEQDQSNFRSEIILRRTEVERHQVCMGMETPAYDDSFKSSSESLLEFPLHVDTAAAYQDYSKAIHCPSRAPEFWG
ncbi:mesoderm posterior protein 1-like [Myxocyprinus asiaticus]|uniref:mesoderm posterior protein 1-like n=1 Tax=Myxocyprinus asiaticus TaxID=70543 RepID=UPI002222C9AD|nr:mesoderm posterior protein 1-like [Myxocyprinus asiaticus]